MKYINAWSITRNNSKFGDPGDVVLIYNDEDGTRRKKNVPFGKEDWYFYVEKTPEARKAIQEFYNVPERIKIGKNWIRIYFPRIEYDSNVLKELVNKFEKAGVKTYEADLGPAKRYCLDRDVKVEDWEKIRVLYFDIETDDTKGGIVIGRDRILSFAAVDRDGNEFFLSDESEVALLNKIKDFIQKYDMLVGWNSKDFDIAYLKARFNIHKISTEYLSNMLQEDMMRRVQYFYMKDPEARQSISSYSLDFISNYFLNEGKVSHPGKIIDLYKNDPALFREYNLQDCRLLKKLEDKLGTIGLTYMMFQWCGCFTQNWSMVKTIDNFILSEANKKGIHYRTNLNQMMLKFGELPPDDGTEFLGAYVFDPIPGYYENVYDLDFKSLYPNIIRTFNISPETARAETEFCTTPLIYDEEGVPHGGMRYAIDEKGIIAGKIGELLDQRDQIKKEMKATEKDSPEWRILNVKQLIVKELANSIYGVLGNKWFRSFSIELAESITSTGQYLIKYVQKINEELGRKVIYGDTDSVFLLLKEGEKIEEVLPWINEKITKHLLEVYGVKDSTIQMALDVKFDKFLIEAKKKYVGKIGEKYKFVGMECVKRDTIPVAVNYQKKLIDKLMAKTSEKTCSKWIEEKKKTILEEPFRVEDISIRKKLSKKPEEYRAKAGGRSYTAPLHVRIVQELANRKSTSGDKVSLTTPGSIIQYVITSGGDGDKAEGVHVSEYKGEWDRVYYWNNVVYPPLQRLLTSVYPKTDWTKFLLKKEKSALAKLRGTKKDNVRQKKIF